MVLLSDSVEGSSCSSTDGLRYEVFLNFRGKDTRKNFTDHLHKALKDSNIKTFLDEEEIETGDFLKPELERAIKASRASILLLSKNYADSAWCLDELVLILQQQKMSGGRKHFAIPIFYHVEPGDVRLHTSTFGDAIAKHIKYLEAETDSDKRSKFAKRIEGWVTALTEVADTDKIDVKLRPETEVIDDIIDRIYGRLHVPLRAATPKPLGMENSIKFVTTWLENPSSNRGDVLAILGMGGIGKTSLAEYIYELRCRTFRTSSFIKDISRKCATKSEELAVLAKQLCGDITRKRSTEVYDIATYTSNIQNAVTNKKVFIVLDDISSLAQLNALLGKKHFHEESKIIITTRDASLTKNCDLLINAEVAPTYEQLKLECLDDTMSRELFFHHAFGSEKPMPKIEKLSEEFLKYCRGHPLSLEVWGKKLHPCREKVDHWNDYIKGLKTEMLPCIKKDLEMSFDSLQSDSDQHLFKHIACFFVGIDRSFSETILEACKLQVITGIENLTDKYLLSIGCNKELVMHPLIQEMGRFLVREESKRTRYWCLDESSNVLTKNKGTENILGLTLDAKMLKNKRLKGKFKIETNALSIMDRLQLLQLNYVKIDGPYENFPEELRWLCMHSFCSESIPTTLQMEFRLQMEFLVVLDLSHSDIKSFGILGENAPPPPETQEESIASCSEDITLPESLKILNLSHCRNLLSVGGFDQLKALERLTVTYCKSLVNVADTITTCSNLVFVDMTYCNMSEELRRTRDMLDHVKTVLA